jgi:hypothetical protein
VFFVLADLASGFRFFPSPTRRLSFQGQHT